jgi:hypothetical protein
MKSAAESTRVLTGPAAIRLGLRLAHLVQRDRRGFGGEGSGLAHELVYLA